MEPQIMDDIVFSVLFSISKNKMIEIVHMRPT